MRDVVMATTFLRVFATVLFSCPFLSPHSHRIRSRRGFRLCLINRFPPLGRSTWAGMSYLPRVTWRIHVVKARSPVSLMLVHALSCLSSAASFGSGHFCILCPKLQCPWTKRLCVPLLLSPFPFNFRTSSRSQMRKKFETIPYYSTLKVLVCSCRSTFLKGRKDH